MPGCGKMPCTRGQPEPAAPSRIEEAARTLLQDARAGGGSHTIKRWVVVVLPGHGAAGSRQSRGANSGSRMAGKSLVQPRFHWVDQPRRPRPRRMESRFERPVPLGRAKGREIALAGLEAAPTLEASAASEQHPITGIFCAPAVVARTVPGSERH